MSVFRSIGKRMGVDFGDFGQWMDAALKAGSPHRKIFDRYDTSLRAIEVAEARLEVWVMVNVDKPTFDSKYWERQKRVMRLERRSMEVLQKVFNAYKRDRALGK